MAWTTRQHSKGAIDRAGAALLQAGRPAELDNELLAVINNWRGCHAYPLHAVTMTLRRRAKTVGHSAVIAQRLKRLPSNCSQTLFFEPGAVDPFLNRKNTLLFERLDLHFAEYEPDAYISEGWVSEEIFSRA